MTCSFTIFGDHDDNTIDQFIEACSLPVAAKGALMPDGHLGYGLPIGGVLATDGAVIPYAVGFDIACRVKITIFHNRDDGSDFLDERDNIIEGIERHTRFGVGSSFDNRQYHPIMDDERWDLFPWLDKDKAWDQLGTSGSGNHFVDVGYVCDEKDREEGRWPAVLSHSGSRGSGHAVCTHFSAIAKEQHPDYPTLAWLDMDSEEGQLYWTAMNLMGDYASANHACIHRNLTLEWGLHSLMEVENHHNFAWEEDGLIVHRKGATPAHKGALGVIPGTMLHAAHIVRGLGDPASINSSAHGAGRRMSRKAAKRDLDVSAENTGLQDAGITVISAGADELPGAYKSIDEVMSQQEGLAETISKFQPMFVKMANG